MKHKEPLLCDSLRSSQLVPKRWTDFGQGILFHGVKDPSPFLRINVFSAKTPVRESFRLESTAPDDWSTKMVFYVFSKEVRVLRMP